ncbi:MAG: 50S ribosomal protein L1 [Chloroflexota bacterium]|nr:50S ribosomal protein L1 [Chloroflexota bacterium]
MASHSKRYVASYKLVDKQKSYTAEEAVKLLKEKPGCEFDESVDLHLRTGSDPKQSDQLVRGVVVLPHGRGKTIRVAVFAVGEAARIAREANADYVGDEDLAKRVEGGWADFEVALATADMMGRIGRLGRFLGRKGLMPNPRTGTVVQPQDLPRAINEARKGRIEFRMDRTAIIHCPLGKIGFEDQQLLENLGALMDAINRAKPTTVKGQFIRTAFLTTTMGPSVKLDLSSMTALKAE